MVTYFLVGRRWPTQHKDSLFEGSSIIEKEKKRKKKATLTA